MRPDGFAIITLFVGSLVAGLGFCALLPPFEGFDETAHYSYVQQIAQTGTWPRLNEPVSADVDDYLKVAPGPAALPPRWTYRAFFKASADTVHGGAAAIHTKSDPARAWHAGTTNNWERQQPPFYYTLLVPGWVLSRDWSIYSQLFLLRSISYLFAWSGLVIATFTFARGRAVSSIAPVQAVGPALWPALFPMWFPEMARLGNDSLVLLILALALVVIRKAILQRGKTFHFALLGAVCGLGLLTKATMLPFVAALGVFLTWRVWRGRSDISAFRASVSQLLVFCLVTTAVAGWWYTKNLIDYGDFIGTNQGVALAEQGGLLKGLSEKFSLLMFIRGGIVGNFLSFVWSGTWSFIQPRLLAYIPLIILYVVVATGWIWHAAKTKVIPSIEVIAALTLIFFIVAMLHLTLAFIALVEGYSHPGAWHLHAFAPLLAILVARGLVEATAWPHAGQLLGALVLYPLLFLLFATVLALFYFAGCFDSRLDISHFSHSDLAALATCAASPREVFTHLTTLGNPALALPMFSAGWLTMLAGVVIITFRGLFTLTHATSAPQRTCD